MIEINRTPKIIQNLFNKVIWKHSSNEVLLTFDDGPDFQWTPKISELLNKHDLKAIFFVTGKQISEPTLIRDLSEKGHEIGWHTQNHISFLKSTPTQIISELDAKKRLEDIISNNVKYFRFPYGHFYPWQIKYVLQQKLTPVMWTYMIHDYKAKTSEKLRNKLSKVKPSDILLLHDSSKNIQNTYTALKDTLAKNEISFAKKINIAFSNDL